jgi:hypothetical protein
MCIAVFGAKTYDKPLRHRAHTPHEQELAFIGAGPRLETTPLGRDFDGPCAFERELYAVSGGQVA